MATPQSASAPPAGGAPRTYLVRTRYIQGGGPFRVVGRLTAHGVARWCDAYRVEPWTVSRDGGPVEHLPGRAGTLPADPAGRHAALEELLDWLESTRGGLYPGLHLTRAGVALMDDDALPCALWLTPAQFAALQAWWARFGLPRDLGYAPADASPDADPLFDPEAVTEAELVARKQRLVADCGRLLPALSVRTHQLWGQTLELPDALLHNPALTTSAAEGPVVTELSTALGHALLTLARLANDWAPSPSEPAATPAPA